MRRTLLFLALPLLLTSCAQLFDSNLFASIDQPPPLTASALKDASLDDIQSMMGDDSFYESLKASPDALAALQDNLQDQYTNASTDAAVVDAATAYVLITAKGTEVGDLVTNMASNLPSIAADLGNNDVAGAMDTFLGNKSASEVEDLLTNLVAMADALEAMQAAATSGTAVDSDVFLAGTDNPVAFAQLALLAAAAKAIVATNTDIATTAAALAAGTALTAPDSDFQDALDGTDVNPSTNTQFAYLSAITGTLPFSF